MDFKWPILYGWVRWLKDDSPMYAKKYDSFEMNHSTEIKKKKKMAFDIIKSRKNLRRESIDLFVLIFLYYFGAFVVN